MTSNEIRQAFLDFFKSKEHLVVPSAPMVVKNDPTLMFTNAGMNQFKDIFLGNAQPKHPRLCDAQKCLRVSGKHNDLEEVGHDTYHHTMFEMLGNWSFGDYFKKEAIAYAWEFLTECMHIDKNNLYVTVFGGDSNEGLDMDMEAYGYWKNHIAEERILKGSKKDNFWEMGDQGPCGPCSEIHIDLRPDSEKALVPGRDLVNKDNPLVIEIWNLVFMQYNRQANGTLVPLSAKHIDTGMGFERLCMVMQNKQSNYDTDVFQPLIQEIAAKAGRVYGKDEKADIAMRVCADHLRAVSFSIADGQLPGNAKAGYVIRRILRRAVRYGYTFLGFKEPFLNTLVPTLVGQMGAQYPELQSQQQLVQHIILEEEQAFLKTLANGILRFEEYARNAEHAAKRIIDGAFAFELFDTYGFPIDLTRLMATEQGWDVDMEGFQKGLEEQKQRSRAAAALESDDWVDIVPGIEQQFVGYDTLAVETRITRYRHIATKGQEYYQLVLEQTPFYGEAGGQVGDRGTITLGDTTIPVIDTKKENNLIVHIVPADKFAALINSTADALLKGSAKVQVNEERRRAIECNHSATHLLHKALRRVLGTHVEQKGSSVDDKRLRFDFSHFAKLSHEEIREVERLVNNDIRLATARDERRDMPIEEARELGAMALFGEKYGDHVRVIKFNDSIELCGGTHTDNTGHIGSLRIVSEGAVAAGIRRIEAVTGAAAEQYGDEQQDLLDSLRELLKNPKDLSAAITRLQEENGDLRTQIEAHRKEQALTLQHQLQQQLDGNPVLVQRLDIDLSLLKDSVLQLRNDNPDMALVLASTFGDKPSLLVTLGQNRVDAGKNAPAIVRTAGKEIQGGGGGQPGYATAGGKNLDGLDKAMQVAAELVA
ncbi:MAG: alanine--tRNA ligase [Bacteroidales bacterium]|nr:alanine--tRNA ligase [Bacteroidales bacterium]